MTINNWLTILAIVAGATVSLIVAHLHRKQIRQIELHRADPSVPITPPPSAITRFFRRYRLMIFNVVLNGGVIVHQLLKTGQITRGDIFIISFSTVALAYAFISDQMTQQDLMIYRTIDRIVDFLHEMARYAPSKKDG